jgi:hypothetical protein
MGQAKLRGSFEQRVAEAKIANDKRAQEARWVRLAEEANLTPEERKKRKGAKLLLGTMIAMTANLNQG